MNTRSAFNKFFFIFSLLLAFMVNSCSTPSEDKEQPPEQVAETAQVKPAKVETPAPVVKKSEQPAAPEPMIESTLVNVITMQSPAYPEHKKGIVLFPHKKHNEEYKIACGQCHHDKEGKPLENLEENDKVDACLSCHTKLGQAPRPKNKKKLTKTEKLEYHAEAIHENCIACHKEYNKGNNTKEAPTSCRKCHPKRS